MSRYHTPGDEIPRNIQIAFSLITFSANLVLNRVILTNKNFRKQLGVKFLDALAFLDFKLSLSESVSQSVILFLILRYI